MRYLASQLYSLLAFQHPAESYLYIYGRYMLDIRNIGCPPSFTPQVEHR